MKYTQLFYYHEVLIGQSDIEGNGWIGREPRPLRSKLLYCECCGVSWGKVLTINSKTRQPAGFTPYRGVCLECWATIPLTRILHRSPESYWIALEPEYNNALCYEALLVTLNGLRAAQQLRSTAEC